MSRLLQGERCGDGPSVRKADLGDAGGFLGSDERGGFARRQGRTRDADSQRGVGRVNTGAPRSVGEWAGSAMIALWGGKRRGLEKRPWQGGLSPSARNLPGTCQHLPPSAINCQALPVWNEDSTGLEPGPSTRSFPRVVEDVSTDVWVTRTESRGGRRLRRGRPAWKSRPGPPGGLSPSAISMSGGNAREGTSERRGERAGRGS